MNGAFTGSFAATTGPVIDNAVLDSAIGSDDLTTTALNFAGLIDDLASTRAPVAPAHPPPCRRASVPPLRAEAA